MDTTSMASTCTALVPVSQPAVNPAVEQRKAKTPRNVPACKVDTVQKTITFTKAAMVPNTPAFNELMEMRRMFPEFLVKPRTAKRKDPQNSVKGLTLEFMERHIRAQHLQDVEEFLRQKRFSEGARSPYMYMRKWFVGKYPNWNK